MKNDISLQSRLDMTALVMNRIIILISISATFTSASAADSDRKIDFNRDIRPILSNHCWNCHGQDTESRKAGLRLDLRAEALKRLKSDGHAIVPGKPDESSLLDRIDSTETDEQMPPPSFKKPLNANQRALLRQWVVQGAEYAGHWAFSPPVRPIHLPEIQAKSWPRNTIDFFILDQIEKNGLKPSPEADKNTWLRRVTLDLTGLPPTVADRNRFLEDKGPNAHEQVVDRLLASPAHAERMAMQWLDLARYADTNGYNNDETRTLWPWRDWVIDAFSKNMPYDRFLTEQLAGDLLPNPTISQKVATGFVRNHVLTTEGGIIEAEYQAEYVADRVHTTSTVFMGLSMQCARCHNHKYDPFTQREYYRYAAFFNNIPDKIVPYSKGRMAEPLLQVPSEKQAAEKARLEKLEKSLHSQLKNRENELAIDQQHWESKLTSAELEKLATPVPLVHFPLDETDGKTIADKARDSATGRVIGQLKSVEGKIGKAIELDGSTFIDAGETGSFEAEQPFSSSAWIFPKSNAALTIFSKIDDANAFRGYDVILEQGRLAAHFVNHWPDRAFKIITKKPVALNAWHHIAVVYDGSRSANGAKIYVDGQLQEIEITTNNRLDGSLKTSRSFHIGKRSASAPFVGRIDDVRLYSGKLSAEFVAQLANGKPQTDLRKILAIAPANRSNEQKSLLKNYYFEQIDPEAKKIRTELADLPKLRAELEKSIPVTMVMAEMSPRRPTHVLRRGQYDQPGEVVEPGVMAAFSGLPTEVKSRLELADWLTHPNHPLTARVAVNRYWEMIFGTGLVETVEDFGIQGALPSHPELLDQLAREFIESGWNLRKLLREIVLSATYRQSSHTSRELTEKDPRNRLLARGPRFRLPAETVRDNALAISGLLVQQIGGPSVRPYQPEGLWEDVSVERRERYIPDPGDGLYRRSMYTFWKRTCPPPGMAAFDAPDRETCTVRRARTNTPLQSLVLLNDPTYVEASRKFAEKLVLLPGNDQAKFNSAFEMALCRQPNEFETRVLANLLQASRQRFTNDKKAAEQLISIGQSKVKAGVGPSELAAWTTVSSMILNLDEAISKP